MVEGIISRLPTSSGLITSGEREEGHTRAEKCLGIPECSVLPGQCGLGGVSVSVTSFLPVFSKVWLLPLEPLLTSSFHNRVLSSLHPVSSLLSAYKAQHFLVQIPEFRI